MIASELLPLYDDYMVEISNEEWSQEDTRNMKRIKEWRVSWLKVDRNNRSTLLKEFAHIRFKNLITLCLQNNQIESIEELNSIDMPNILQLSLHANYIISLEMLKKVQWSNLLLLRFYNNCFWNAKTLEKGNFPNLSKLYAYWDMLGEDKNKFFEPCFPLKMQTKFVESICIKFNSFCFNRSTLKVIRQKWGKVSIQ